MLDFFDEGVSGAVPLANRPGGGALLAALQPGDTVVVAKLDRLFRSMVDTVNTMDDWGKRGIILVSLAESIDFSTPWGKTILHILSAIAELERSMAKDRTKAALDAKRLRGERLGHAHYGHILINGRLVENEAEQKVVKEIKSCSDAGMRQGRIAARLNAAGIATRTGRRWSRINVARVLKRLRLMV